MVWEPVNANPLPLPEVALDEEVGALGVEPVVPAPVEVLPALVELEPLPEPAVVVGVVPEEEPPPDEPVGPVAIGLNGSMPGVADATAPVESSTTATTATAAIICPSTLRAVMNAMLGATPVKSVSLVPQLEQAPFAGGPGTLKFGPGTCR